MTAADTQVAVVGGGPAGAACAIALARAGHDVTVLERTRCAAPKVCGEFLAGPALSHLAALGVDVDALGAVPLTTFRFSAGRRTAAAPLPFAARSLTRERLDETLLTVAAEAGASVQRGVRVRRADQNGACWQLDLGGNTVTARHVIIASGKVDIRAHRRSAGTHAGLVGLKAYVKLSPEGARALGAAVDVLLFPGGYCGVEATEEAYANACLVVPADLLRQAGRPEAVIDALAATGLRAETLLAGSALCGPVQAIGSIPYGFVRRASGGAFYVGDQAAVIPSFCGEGIGIALASGRAAAAALIAGENASAFQAQFARRVGWRVQAASLMSQWLCRARWQPVAVAAVGALPGAARAVAAAVRTPVPLTATRERPRAVP